MMYFLHRFAAPCGAPFFLRLQAAGCAALLLLLSLNAHAASDIWQEEFMVGDFARAREAVVEAIETEGLLVSAIIPFGDMLTRTAASLGKTGSPFVQAEIIQFCSVRLAWELIEEMPAQLALCPLSLALYVKTGQPEQLFLAFRQPELSSTGRQQALALLSRIVRHAQQIGRP